MKVHRPSPTPPQTFVLKYMEAPGPRGPVFRPMVPMVLSWRGHPLEVSMLLDTGSDSTFLRASLARELGLEVAPPIGTSGAQDRANLRGSQRPRPRSTAASIMWTP